jgi:outer membrane protein assembly factor BamD (BamD/ComL family)
MRTLLLVVISVVVVFAATASAQRNVTPAIDRDPVMEADAKHNLDVAWQYFKLKKAYKSVIMRFDETHVAYPQFSKMDEFLYLAGMSSYYLLNDQGKQKVDPKNPKDMERFSPDKLRENANVYLTELVDLHPESKYVEDAKKILEELKAKP